MPFVLNFYGKKVSFKKQHCKIIRRKCIFQRKMISEFFFWDLLKILRIYTASLNFETADSWIKEHSRWMYTCGLPVQCGSWRLFQQRTFCVYGLVTSVSLFVSKVVSFFTQKETCSNFSSPGFAINKYIFTCSWYVSVILVAHSF